ncbi:Tar ligand binding domain-containing protein [Serratia marcescens]|uniref:Tar ligand binding domain-containing protein n=1 Tax=Serratia marcescens TaxID=615 RepID=A0A939NK08_SERMA|nr:Tar ligand binding domain-containing protein [Serratia marcescens]
MNELMSSARSSLQKADLYFNQFMAVERSSEQQSQQTATTKASYERLRGALQLIGSEKGELQAFMDQPTQKTQDLFSRLRAVPAAGQRRHQRSQRRQPVLLHAGGPDAGGGGLDADRGDRRRHVVVAYHAGAAAEPNPQPL